MHRRWSFTFTGPQPGTATASLRTARNAHTHGIKVFACANSLRTVGIAAEDLTAGVTTVPAAVTHLAQRQWAGWAYVRL